ncbi:MAG TPA: restriction endonuclease subunit S [Thermoanaerobaculia bacterium]|nr:restriction endonuclease subunit S [Thermoanaerobaculia bacterium]
MKAEEIFLLDEVCNVEYGTRVVQKRDGGSGYTVYGGGGATFQMDKFNREDRIVVARFGMSEECTRFVGGKFFLNDSGLTVSPKSHELLARFLDYQMLSINDSIYALGKGAAQKNLDVPAFRALPLFVPADTNRQQHIVRILDEAFAGIATAKANAQKNLQNARALFESHLQDVFSHSEEGWEDKQLGEVCLQITDGKHGDCNNEASSGFFFLSAKDVRNGTLNYETARQITKADFEETHRRTNLEPGDILITNSGTIGRMAIAPMDDRTRKTTFQKSVAILKPIREELDSRFAFYCLSAGLTRFVNLSAGAAQKNLLLRDLRTYRFMRPNSLGIQKKVAMKLDSLSAETQRLESIYQQKLAALDALKKSLLHRAFIGQL